MYLRDHDARLNMTENPTMPETTTTAPLFGIHTIPTIPWPEIRDRWRFYEDLGFDSLWLPDHFFPVTGRDKPMFEAWTLLAGLAMLTSRARIGVLVSSNTFRHPALLAKQAVTVDHLSEGRLDVGIGTGWLAEEHEVFGIALPEPKVLVDRYEEAVALLDRYLSHDESSFAGTHFRVTGAFNRPAPVQRPRPPLVMGAHGPRMLKLVARYADTWNSYAPPEELARRNAHLTELCEEIGRDPAEIKRSMFYGVNMAPEDDPWASPDAFAEYIGRYAEAGMQEFILQAPKSGDLRMMERIAADVITQMRAG
jgi:alkanesulfonate monooxygenase SsuD/methylene tetrahydromethanopterin reductase-like flavin-dependent oxidoreductase (luciferase family)